MKTIAARARDAKPWLAFLTEAVGLSF